MDNNNNKNKNDTKITPLKKQMFALGGILLFGGLISWIFMGSFAVNAWNFFSGKIFTGSIEHKSKLKAEENIAPVSLTAPRLLDGMIVSRQDANIMPVGVMIENLPQVRPQSGLSRARIVYETLAEGMTTRFLAVFDQNEMPETIGPVRSSRPYYLEWISELNGYYVHAGGSPEALAAIDGLELKDLNALTKGQYFWRDSSQSAPHNLYTSGELLERALRDFNYKEDKADFQPWKYGDDPVLENRPQDAKSVIIKFSGYSYQAEYRYNRESDEYLRFNAGQPHLDRNTGDQIRAKNVIAVQIPNILDIGEKGRLTLDIEGEGKTLVARHGEVIEGTWKKPDRVSRTVFYDQAGTEIELGRGATWVHILPENEEFYAE